EDIGVLAKEDIAGEEVGVRFGRGWYPVERHQDELLRWVENDAIFTVDAPPGPARALCLEMEPGPGVGFRPFEIAVRDETSRVGARGLVEGRQNVHLTLPVRPGQIERFCLHIEGGGLPTPYDTRTLNCRAFRFRWSFEAKPVATPNDPTVTFNFKTEDVAVLSTEDIASPETGLRFSRGWYPVEKWNGEVFRWAENNATVTVDAPEGPARALSLDIEPGPGVFNCPFELQVRDEQDQTVARGVV